MHPRHQQYHNEIEKGINRILNTFTLVNKNTIDREIDAHLSEYLKGYHQFRKIYDWKISSNYPKIEIYVQYMKAGEIHEIKPLRFERLQKLLKLETISETL